MQTLLTLVRFLNNTVSFSPAPTFTYANMSSNIFELLLYPQKTFGLQMICHSVSTKYMLISLMDTP